MSEIDHTQPANRSLAAKLLRLKVAIPVTLVLVLLLSPVVIRQWNLRGVPDVGEPFEDVKIPDTPLPVDENAWFGFIECQSLLDGADILAANYVRNWTQNAIRVDQVLRNWVNENETFCAQWEVSASKPACKNPDEWDRDGVALPVTGFRGADPPIFYATMLLRAKALFDADDVGPWAAWDSYRLMLRTAAHLQFCGEFTSYLHGSGYVEIATNEIDDWLRSPELTSEQLRQALRELDVVMPGPDRFGIHFRSEYERFVSNLDEFIELDREQETRVDAAWRYFAAEPELSDRVVKVVYANLAAAIDRPMHELRFEHDPHGLYGLSLILDRDGTVVGLSGLDAASFFSAAHRSRLIEFDSVPIQSAQIMTILAHHQLDRDCLRVSFAGHAFYRDEHRFPDRLDELIPAYLAEIPADPYTGERLKYRLDDEGAVIYSAYENKRDDGGFHYSFHQPQIAAAGGRPADYGKLIRTPAAQPLIAPKPAAPAPVLNFP